MKPRLIVNCGGMFSGKSTNLIRQGERHLLADHRVVFIKPSLDTRYSKNAIVTHKGQKVESLNMKDAKNFLIEKEILAAEVVLIDEVQFIDNAVYGIQKLLELNKTIYCSGLDMDYLGVPFQTMASLMAMADEVNKFHAVCTSCGEDALFSHKLTSSKERIELGEKDKYTPLCRKCYANLKENEDEENHC